jgi:lambda family phage minor tail protein L
MTLTTNQNFKNLRDSPEGEFVYLYSIYNYDGVSADLHFIDAISNLVYGGVTYVSFPISHSAISENISGAIDAVNVKISNISRAIQAYLEVYDFSGLKVTIKTVLDVTDGDCLMTDTYYIDSYTADQLDVNFICTSKLDIHKVQLPLRIYSREYCQWTFKGTECKYVGAGTCANKTKQECIVNGNLLNFGGCPSIRSSKVYT